MHACLFATITPKYIFSNEIAESVYFRDEESATIREIPSKQREPLLFSKENPQ